MRPPLLAGALLLALVIKIPSLQAQEKANEPVELKQPRAQYEALERDLDSKVHQAIKLQTADYVSKLRALETQIAATGNLDAVLPLRAEQKAYEGGKTTNGFDPNDPVITPAARQLRAAFDADLVAIGKYKAAQEKRYAGEYCLQLQGIERALTIAGRVDDAIAVRAERTNVAAQYLGAHTITNASPTTQPDVSQWTVPPNSFQWAGFFEFLQTAAQSPQISKSVLGKRDRGKPFQEIRKDGAFLIGFELTKGDWFGAPLFQSIQPIYFTAKGKDMGQREGNSGHDPFTIEAREGYAVSGVNMHDGQFIWSIQVTFTKIDLLRQTLNPADSYKSDVYGDVADHPDWAPDKQLGADTPIIGWFGYAESEINAFGLVQAPPVP